MPSLRRDASYEPPQDGSLIFAAVLVFSLIFVAIGGVACLHWAMRRPVLQIIQEKPAPFEHQAEPSEGESTSIPQSPNPTRRFTSSPRITSLGTAIIQPSLSFIYRPLLQPLVPRSQIWSATRGTKWQTDEAAEDGQPLSTQPISNVDHLNVTSFEALTGIGMGSNYRPPARSLAGRYEALTSLHEDGGGEENMVVIDVAEDAYTSLPPRTTLPARFQRVATRSTAPREMRPLLGRHSISDGPLPASKGWKQFLSRPTSPAS